MQKRFLLQISGLLPLAVAASYALAAPGEDRLSDLPFDPAAGPSLEGIPVQQVVVTTQSLAGAFQDYAARETMRGIPTVVRTLVWIESRYGGADTPARIRAFLQDARMRWGTRWAVLGGDAEQVPVRYVPWIGGMLPTDLYYECLDGEWNDDGDSLIGEAHGDNPDLLPDLVVGRVPARTPAEVGICLAKLRRYEKATPGDHATRALFLGEMITGQLDGRDTCLEIADLLPSGFESSGLYESEGMLSAHSARAALSAGHGVVLHYGHGSYDILGSGPGLELLFHRDLAEAADASERRAGLFVTLSCFAGGFDQDAVVERLLLHPDGGAVATVGNVRDASPIVDAEMARVFFEELLASEWGRPAEAMAASRARLVSENPNAYRVSGARRFMYFGRSFLGFPTLSLHRGEPGTLRVDHPTVLSARRAPFPVRVTGAEDGLPVEGARVCLSKGDEDYAFGTTDETGRVLFQFRPEHHGVADLVVTAPGRVPYDAALPVNASASAHLVSAGWRGVGATGSGGEWRVQLAVENAGRVASPGGSVSLSAAGEGVVVMDGAGSVSVVAPGDTAWTTAFTLRSAACATDGDRLPVLLDGEPGSGLTSEPYLLSAELAEVVIAGMEIRGGRILPLLENRGSGSSGVLFASLTVAAGEGSVAEGEVTAGRLAPGEEVLLEPGFSASGPSGVTFRLDVECSRGTRVTRIVNLSPPAGASAASSSPRPESAVLSWTSGPSGDTAGYRILLPGRRGWRDAFGHLLRQGSVAEIPLPAGSRSAFAVIAVDSSGLASPDTAFGEARSNDPLLPGWPQRLDSVVGPTPLVPADLDGDGLPEIVLGSMWPSNAVHVFRASGSEWVDGDADPATAGHFGTTGGRVNAAPLVVDLDGDGRGEIVAASYDGFVYAWRTDGANAAPDPVPGWPVFHAATGLRSSPVAADVDGDGLPEIVTVAHDGRIRALEADGSLVPGWPRVTGRGGTGSTPAVADLDGDGRDDVVVSGTDSLLYALSGSGEDLPGWPVAMGAEGLASPVLADLDGDGTLEVIAPDEDGRIHAFRLSDGDGDGVADSCPGWPVSGASSEATIPSPAVADLDGDGFPEVIANANRRVCAWRADGTPLPGWPIPAAGNAANSPVVADLDGDGRLDVLVGRTDGTLTAHAPDGTVVPGWPWSFTEIPWATPAVADMDGDGDLDVLIGADDGRVRIVDAPGSAAYGTAPWPVYHGGADLAGVYRPLSDATALPPAGTSDSPAVLSLASPFPNPFRDQTLLRFALPETGPVTLTLHDVAGRRVACLLDERLLPSGDHSVVWDGHAARGGRTAPGVYFVRLALRGESESVRIVHLW